MLFSIRRMSGKDLDEILAIEEAAYRIPWSRRAFEAELRAQHAFPLVIGQSSSPFVLGYICSWLTPDECHILNLAVHPSFRRMGLASQLMETLIETCRKRGVMDYFLEVRISNEEAIALYRKLGFRVCGLRKRYYADTGEDALVMQRSGLCH
jgi:[ribosomal protein S18]-alanine N-acetyltransferase